MSLKLITDRTQADFELWRMLSQIPWSQMSAAQKAIWAVPMKGAYNFTDLNRVGEAMLTLQSLFAASGYSVTVTVRTNYTAGEWPTNKQMQDYIQSVKKLRAVIPLAQTTPAAPDSMDNGTVLVWNNIEQILLEVEAALDRLIAALLPRQANTQFMIAGGIFNAR